MQDAELVRARNAFEQLIAPPQIGQLLREVLDRAIDSGRTNRITIADLDKSAKTAVGTEVEVALREVIRVPRGRVLDLVLDGVEVDVKWSGAVGKEGNSWMIPEEALGGIVILTSAWDTPEGSRYTLGWLRVPADGKGLAKPNKDSKRSILKATLNDQVLWVSRGREMPRNLLLTLEPKIREQVMAQPAGEKRIREAFRLLRGTTITRQEVLTLDVADPTRRVQDLMVPLREEGISVIPSGADAWMIR